MTPPPRRHGRTDGAQAGDVPQWRNFIAAFLVAIAVFVFLYLIHAVLLPFVVAGVTAYVFTPVVEGLARHTRLPRLACAFIVFAMLMAIVAAVGYVALPGLLRETIRLLTDLEAVIQTMLEHFMGSGTIQLLGQPTTASQIAAKAVGGLRDYVQRASSILTLVTWTFVGIFSFFLTWTLLAYFLISGHRVARGILWLFPPQWRPQTGRILLRLHPILRRYFTGIAIVVTYACVAAYIGLGLILNLHHAAFLAVFTGFLEIVPVIGPVVSAVVAGLVAVMHAQTLWSILAYVIYATALRLSIDQLVGPIVLGKAARVHPSLIIFCFLSGGLLFGIAGMILAVPVALTIKVTLATIYRAPLVGEPKRVSRKSR
jgi:predicted PurR-regulated permease PerM